MKEHNVITYLLSAKADIEEAMSDCTTCECTTGPTPCKCNACSTWNRYMSIIERLAFEFGCTQREIMQLLEVE
jgi:hypothetical protein